jgi:hypothetical protein
MTHKRGAEYLIITKERLVLVFVHYDPIESFFHQGQKYTISNFIRGIWPLCPTALTRDKKKRWETYEHNPNFALKEYKYFNSIFKRYLRINTVTIDWILCI